MNTPLKDDLIYEWESLSIDSSRPQLPKQLSLRAGERILIQGPSGSGKSQWMKRLIGLDPHHQERIRFKGSILPILELRKNVLWIPQTPVREAMTIAEWVRERRQFIHMTSEFETLLSTWLPQLSHDSTRLMTQLSGGELQAVMMAFAISSHAEVLLLDESTSAMDPKLQEQIEAQIIDSTSLSLIWIRHDSLKTSQFHQEIQFHY